MNYLCQNCLSIKLNMISLKIHSTVHLRKITQNFKLCRLPVQEKRNQQNKFQVSNLHQKDKEHFSVLNSLQIFT